MNEDLWRQAERLFRDALKHPPAEAPRKINIVLNWFEELKRLVPGK